MKTTTNLIAIIVLFIASDVTVAQNSMAWMEQQQIPGLALAEKTADVAAVVSQRLTEVHVEEGERVTKGQLLGTLEYAVVQAEYESAMAAAKDRSAVEIATIDVKEASEIVRRLETALARAASNQLEVRNARNNYTKAIAILNQQKSALLRASKAAETAKAQLEAYKIRAPFDGVVVERHVSIGNFVKGGDPIFSVVAPAKLKAELNLPLSLFGKLKQGEFIELSAGAPVSRSIQAKLQFVSPTIDSASQTFRCVFTINNSAGKLPAGFPVQLSGQQMSLLRDGAKPTANPNQTIAKN